MRRLCLENVRHAEDEEAEKNSKVWQEQIVAKINFMVSLLGHKPCGFTYNKLS